MSKVVGVLVIASITIVFSLLLYHAVFAIIPITLSTSPAGGTYNSAQSVTLTASVPATIYYTTDGSIPTTSSPSGVSPVSGIVINTNATLKYFAKDAGGNLGSVVTEVYVISASQQNALDKFGVTELYPTIAGGREYFSSWDNGVPRSFVDMIDPNDPWLDAGHGSGTYTIDGKGTLTASGDFARIFVHDPANQTEWKDDLEITVYITRINETQVVSPAGTEIYARTNQGVGYPEDQFLCDDRGYGAKPDNTGRWAFEKETAHGMSNGFADTGAAKPPTSAQFFPNGMPKNTPIGVKYLVYNLPNNQVKLELWADLTNGLNGGSWQKVTEFTDNGTNLGVGNDPCKVGVDPALPLIRNLELASSEFGKPHMTVLLEDQFGAMAYQKLSIREITSPPTLAPTVSTSPAGGTYNSAQSVTLTASVPATIYYTTDGSTPTTSSLNATSPVSGIVIDTNATLKYFAQDSFGNSSPIITQVYTIIPSSTADVFGITKLYSTTSGGREWFARWSTPAHIISSEAFDPYDSQFQSRGDGYVYINGDGTAYLNGSTPRMYVFDPSFKSLWKNVEITFYGKRVSESQLVSWQGFESGARAGSHEEAKYPDVCTDSIGFPDTADTGRITYDGRVDFEKEVLFHRGDAVSNDTTGFSPIGKPSFTTLSTPRDPTSGFHTAPYNTWVGYKFVVRNTSDGGAVKMEVWMDPTDGKDGGTWVKLNEYVDQGGWRATHFYANFNATNWPCPHVSLDYNMTHAMPYVFVRADFVKEIDYKKFSIREIDPLTTASDSQTNSMITKNGTASANQTIIGVNVAIAGITEQNGTAVAVSSKKLNSTSDGVGAINLGGPNYYDVHVSGIITGTANICIKSSTVLPQNEVMQYWAGIAWTSATSITISGNSICGDIPVSALSGTNIAIGSSTPPVGHGGNSPGSPPTVSSLAFSGPPSAAGGFAGILIFDPVHPRTTTVHVGEQEKMELVIKSDRGVETLEHVALYMNLRGDARQIADSDTYLIYEKFGPLQIADPHGYFYKVNVETSEIDATTLKVIFDVTFAKEMKKSDVYLRSWTTNKNSMDTGFADAIEVVNSASNGIVNSNGIANNNGITDNNGIANNNNQTVTNTTQNSNSPLFASQNQNLVESIKKWSGYSQETISDSQLLSDMGIKANHIPSWFMKTAKWIVSGETTLQEFTDAVQYMYEKGIVR